MAKYTLKNIIDTNVVEESEIGYLINTVRGGIKFSAFNSVAENGPFTLTEWSDYLHISERTMQRYKKSKGTFDTLQSEKILQILLVFRLGKDVFSSFEKFNIWLDSKNIALGNIKPKSLLDNAFGIELVKDELTRIAHGVLA